MGELQATPEHYIVAVTDDDLLPWLLGISENKPTEPGGFLKALAQAAFHADRDDYAILRPALLKIKAKYPSYFYAVWEVGDP